MSLLNKITTPRDLKTLTLEELDELSLELREKIIDTVSKNGGHLASNLGVVELTLALHRVFDCPKDKIIFDVGHQCYVHKLVTGRLDKFDTIRRYGGLSGFEKRSESEYDAFGTGHSSTSISAALGIATAAKLNGDDSYTIAVAGDGAFTGGMVYEALNNLPKNDLKLIIILNDNEMSISPNVGGLSRYLSKIRVSSKYFNLKHKTKKLLSKLPTRLSNGLLKFSRGLKEFIKRLFGNVNFFECLGIDYIGLVDGTDIVHLESVLREAKRRGGPCLVHVLTKKGSGYEKATEKPDLYHSVGSFNIDEGYTANDNEKFSGKFGEIITKKAATDENIVAITAAMKDGTGLTSFADHYPNRFFDVGIAEEHAATFAAGLCAGGKKAVFAVYSSFLQRSYDQLVHDIALQKLPVVLAVDRAGLVCDDGPTHHGVFDVSFLSSIPNVSIYSPENFDDMDHSFKKAFEADHLTAVRYPRGKALTYENDLTSFGDLAVEDWGDNTVTIITYGKITKYAHDAAKLLAQKGIGTRLVKLVKIWPLNVALLNELVNGSKLVFVLEEGVKQGGIGEKISSLYDNVFVRAIDNTFVSHGDYEKLLDDLGMTSEKIVNSIYESLTEKL